MRIQKFVLAMLLVFGSTLFTPILADKTPYSVSIVQQGNGDIAVKSELQAVLDGFKSLVLNDGKTEVVFLVSSVIRKQEALYFVDPGLTGEIDYCYTTVIDDEEISMLGKVALVKRSDGSISDEDVSFQGAFKPTKPFAFDIQRNLTGFINVYCEDPNVRFDIQWSRKKNSGFKTLKQSYYKTDGDSFSSAEGSFRVKPGTKYFYRARAFVMSGNKKVVSSWTKGSFTAGIGSPMNLCINIVDKNTLDIRWDKAVGADRYAVWVEQGDWVYDPVYDDEDWESWAEFYRSNIRGTSILVRDSDFDFTKTFEVEVEAYNSEKRRLEWGSAGIDDIVPELLQIPVSNVSVAANASGSELTFTFKSSIDMSVYKPIRGLTGVKPTHAAITDKAQGFDKVTDEYSSIDFSLFASTSINGPWKRVNTTANFNDSNNLKLYHQPITGRKLFYKVLPTWGLSDESYSSGEHVVNMNTAATVLEFTLVPGKPENITGKSLSKKKVQIAVDKGVKITGYELFDANTNKMIKRQKGNIFQIAAVGGVARSYKIRSFRMLGKTRIYSEFSVTVTVTAQ